MQQPYVHPRDDRAAYEYSAQATEDRYEVALHGPQPGSKSPVWIKANNTPNYKPKPLRWQFITTVIVLLIIALALVIIAEKQMPGSDNSASILGLHPNATQPLRFARQVTVNTSESTVSGATTTVATALSTTPTLISSSNLPSSGVPSSGEEVVDLVQSTPLLTSTATMSLTASASSLVGSTGAPSTLRTAGSSDSTVSLPSGASVIPVSTSVSTFTTSITVSVTTETWSSEFTTVSTSFFTTVSTVSSTFTATVTTPLATTFPESTWSSDGSQGTIAPSTGFSDVVQTTTAAFAVPTTITGATTFTTIGTAFGTNTLTGVVIPSVGEVTITYYSTILPSTPDQPITQQPDPVGFTGVEVIGDDIVTFVHTEAPVVLVVPSEDAQTRVIEQQITTGVTEVGGSVITQTVVITPSPGVFVPVVTLEGGVLTTIADVVGGQVGQPLTYTAVNNVGGTPVTQVVVTTPAGPPFQPITYTVVQDVGGTLVTDLVVTTPTVAPGQPITFTAVDIVGGSPVTQLLVTTPTGAPFQPVTLTVATNIGGTESVVTFTPSPTTLVETIDGTPVTIISNPPVTSFTTTIGGTPGKHTLVTTPTGTEPITLTFVSTSGATLSTFTSTIPPTTYTTTRSGISKTITSTPSPSTSLSTKHGTTRTFTSTSTPTLSATASNPPAPSATGTTRVFRWTEADIFVGTFLPPLLGVGLVIPLRIIDLNAKLYQPFQTLAGAAAGGGRSGAETLLMQYSGLMAFVTPVVTMLQGHPIPFLTTIMVGFASLMVPLATEAVGLKLHGQCYQNTASPTTCAPALGVSPVPAHALMGLMAAVIVLLVLVLLLMSRWTTGVFANPWNIAGIASLAGNPQVHIQQNSERAMRRAVATKQYGLGYFQNAATGREEYGIVLTDEAGRGLQDQDEARLREADSESELLEANEAVANGGSLSQHLPFMTLRLPWRISFVVFQLAVMVFVIVYHTYYRGGIRDNGRLWRFMNANTFGVRFVAAIVGVIIAFCWQSFFLSVSVMVPYTLMAQRTQPASRSILFTPSTNPFSGLYSAIKHRHLFLLSVSVAAILSEFLPVVLSNVPFNLAQTRTAATVCAALSVLFLGVMLSVLAWSFFVRYPPMPVDPRCIAGMLYYVSQSPLLLEEMEGVSVLDGKEREARVAQAGRRYFYGVLAGGSWRRLGVDCDAGPGPDVITAYQGAQGLVGEDPGLQSGERRTDGQLAIYD